MKLTGMGPQKKARRSSRIQNQLDHSNVNSIVQTLLKLSRMDRVSPKTCYGVLNDIVDCPEVMNNKRVKQLFAKVCERSVPLENPFPPQVDQQSFNVSLSQTEFTDMCIYYPKKPIVGETITQESTIGGMDRDLRKICFFDAVKHVTQGEPVSVLYEDDGGSETAFCLTQREESLLKVFHSDKFVLRLKCAISLLSPAVSIPLDEHGETLLSEHSLLEIKRNLSMILLLEDRLKEKNDKAEKLTFLRQTIHYFITRPSGHHAERDESMGFCPVCTVGILANVLQKHQINVAIYDFDIHGANWADDNNRIPVLDITTQKTFPYMAAVGTIEIGTVKRVFLKSNLPPDQYIKKSKQYLHNFLQKHTPDLLLVSAGLDAAEGDPSTQHNSGKQRLLSEHFNALGRLIISETMPQNIPLICLQEGGYEVDVSEHSVEKNLEAFMTGVLDMSSSIRRESQSSLTLALDEDSVGVDIQHINESNPWYVVPLNINSCGFELENECLSGVNQYVLHRFFNKSTHAMLDEMSPLFSFFNQFHNETRIDILRQHDNRSSIVNMSTILAYGLENYFGAVSPVISSLFLTLPLDSPHIIERLLAQRTVLEVFKRNKILPENKIRLFELLYSFREFDVLHQGKVMSAIVGIGMMPISMATPDHDVLDIYAALEILNGIYNVGLGAYP